MTSVHARLGHDRRWYMEYWDTMGRIVLQCMVNYKTKMVWDHLLRQLYDFEGQQYEFAAEEGDRESEDPSGEMADDDDEGEYDQV